MFLIDSFKNKKIQLTFEPHTLYFKQASGTSRGVLTEKKLWILTLTDENKQVGIGECSVIPGLSPDFESIEKYELKLKEVCSDPLKFLMDRTLLKSFPSILFGIESCMLDWQNGGNQIYFSTKFCTGDQKIPINGLVWMGTKEFMQNQIDDKIANGFSCIKMKVGAIDFDAEMELLSYLRSKFPSDKLEIRVDANGAFSISDVREKLKVLSQLEIHSIEQPIRSGNWNEMAKLCAENILPIALDEELIGVTEMDEKIELLETIRPQYIILKPSLHGGLSGTAEWIQLAEERNIPWWMTSALESNIGLNTIAQFASSFKNNLPQGLGTGGLYTSNFPSKLTVENGFIFIR